MPFWKGKNEVAGSEEPSASLILTPESKRKKSSSGQAKEVGTPFNVKKSGPNQYELLDKLGEGCVAFFSVQLVEPVLICHGIQSIWCCIQSQRYPLPG